MSDFTLNLQDVEANILEACQKSGRSRENVTLIAVSKTHPVPVLEEAYAEGIRVFGENKVQELSDKIEALPKDIEWHMIGHLQRNKVKYIARDVYMIHSVESYRLAETINKEAAKNDRIIPVLLEVNVAEEETKFGLAVEEVLPLAEQISAEFPNVRIEGLMTIAPYVADPEENRPVFKTLRQLSVDIAEKNLDNVHMNVLSMGMTNDYQIAIEEGATHIRVGTGLFGARDYSKK